MQYLLITTNILALHKYVLSQTDCDSGYFEIVDGECVFDCNNEGNYVSPDSLSFETLMNSCYWVEWANLMDSEACSTLDDLKWHDVFCNCPYCGCQDSSYQTKDVKWYDWDGPHAQCRYCECTDWNGWDNIYICGILQTAYNPSNWELYDTCPPKEINECTTTSYDGTEISYKSNWYWWEDSEDPDALCETFCYCSASGDSVCATGWDDILSNDILGPEVHDDCFNWQSDDSVACYDMEAASVDTSRLFTTSDGYCSDNLCPECDCGSYSIGDTWYIEYQSYSDRENGLASCVECTCTEHDATTYSPYYISADCNPYTWIDGQFSFGSYEIGTVLCHPVSGAISVTSKTYYCHSDGISDTAAVGTIHSDICYSDTGTDFCQWYKNDTTNGTHLMSEYYWGCGEGSSNIECEAFANGECIWYGINTTIQTCDDETYDFKWTKYQYCCTGEDCNHEDIDTSTCKQSTEYEAILQTYYNCLYKPQTHAWYLVCDEYVDDISCDDLLVIFLQRASCECEYASALYRRVSNETKEFMIGNKSYGATFDSYSEWNSVFGCNITIYCDYHTGNTSYGDEVGIPIGGSEVLSEINVIIKFGSQFFLIIVGVAGVTLFIAILCILYLCCCGGTRKRIGLPHTGTIKDTLKRIIPLGLIGIFIEIFDIATDYLYCLDLIGSDSSDVRILGWISLGAAIIGVILFGIKILLTRKLMGGQVTRLMTKMESATNAHQQKEIAKQIRKRIVDVDVLSLLMACCEDVPQALIVMIMRNSNAEWMKPISVLNLSLAVISFWWKFVQVFAANLGCKDPRVGEKKINKQMESEIEMEQMRLRYQRGKQNKEAAKSASYYSDDGNSKWLVI